MRTIASECQQLTHVQLPPTKLKSLCPHSGVVISRELGGVGSCAKSFYFIGHMQLTPPETDLTLTQVVEYNPVEGRGINTLHVH